MDASVNLDDQPGRGHEEVDDEGTDRLLPAHAESGELGAAQPLPEQLFGRGWVFAKGAGLLD
jgi:hypothetical protein